jgi:hypothetical protein
LAGYLKSSRYQQAFIDPPARVGAKAQQLAALKVKVRECVVADLASRWLRQVGLASRYLLAAHKVKSVKPAEPSRCAEVARQFDLDAACLERWLRALGEKETRCPDHPLYAWAECANPDGKSSERQALQLALQEQVDQARHTAASTAHFEDFVDPEYRGWHVTGDAFGTGPARAGDIILGDCPDQPVARFVSAGAHSGLLSERLQGELRSRTFTIDKRYVHLRLAGRHARINLVIDGYTLIMNPIYGPLTVPAAEGRPVWRTIPVDQWLGHRAYLEVSDSSIPLHALNPPPSTGQVPEGLDDSYIALEQVLFSDDPNPPPAVPNRLNLLALEQARGDDLEALADAYQGLMVRELERWRLCKMASAPDGNDGVALLNWLLKNRLLEGSTFSPRAVKDSAAEAAELAGVLRQYRELEATLPTPRRAPALADGTGEDEFVFLLGNYKTPGERVPRRPPEILARSVTPAPTLGSGRLELAQRLMDPSNPLLARVMVNRIWQHHFGAGIVRTPDDFGRMGQRPSHPKLLDYLAAEFVRRGWSVKQMHRLMLVSSSYRMSCRADDAATRLDPENRLLSHMSVRRLEAEAVRDAILAVSGRLNARMHGPSVVPYLTADMEGRGRPQAGPLDGDGRRSIYLNARRNFLTPLLLAFDYPSSFSTIGSRGVSTVPAQALTLMNDQFVVQQAARWAEWTLEHPGRNDAQRIEALYQTAFARPPSAAERRDMLLFLKRQAGRYGCGIEDPRVWSDLCHVLINVKEFIFID